MVRALYRVLLPTFGSPTIPASIIRRKPLREFEGSPCDSGDERGPPTRHASIRRLISNCRINVTPVNAGGREREWQELPDAGADVRACVRVRESQSPMPQQFRRPMPPTTSADRGNGTELRLSQRQSRGASSGNLLSVIVGVQSEALIRTEKTRGNMSYVFALTLPGLSLLLLRHVCKTGNGNSDLLHDQVSNIDCGTVQSTLGVRIRPTGGT